MKSKSNKKQSEILLPIFDAIDFVQQQKSPPSCYLEFMFSEKDFQHAKAFLLSYNGNLTTFNAYRRDVERLLHWSWLIANKSVRDLKRTDIEAYLQFCQDPPLTWISDKKGNRFIQKEGSRLPNPDWRPFVATVSKSEHRAGKRPDRAKYVIAQKTLREILTITGSFYNFLIQEEYTAVNPVLHLRQKSRYFTKVQGGKQKIRRLSGLQWHYVIETAELLAQQDPIKHEKTLFMMTALYSMYLRISELAASPRWTPKMCDFHCDYDGLWWFTTIGKGNKERQISVSDEMLNALRRYRKSLNLSPLPSITDTSPLFPKLLGKGPITSVTYIRKIVQYCFDAAIERLKEDGFQEDAEALIEATVHWLRHTGISEDVKLRPREHVRDDAGHSSSAITDKYIDIEKRARHASAKKKSIKSLEE